MRHTQFNFCINGCKSNEVDLLIPNGSTLTIRVRLLLSFNGGDDIQLIKTSCLSIVHGGNVVLTDDLKKHRHHITRWTPPGKKRNDTMMMRIDIPFPDFHHSQLPAPLSTWVSIGVLEDVPYADWYLLGTFAILTALIFVQLRAFARPEPVPLKRLPRRPVLQVLFKPDDVASFVQTAPSMVESQSTTTQSRRPSEMLKAVTRSIFRKARSMSLSMHDEIDEMKDGRSEHETVPAAQHDQHTTSEGDQSETDAQTESPWEHLRDLPDSFAPLLSSSQVEIIRNQLTADLIHAIKVQAKAKLNEGRHEIPLDKDNSRPQFLVEPPKGGCRVTAVAAIGSDGLTTEEDMDLSRPSTSRSWPMVKNAGVVLDPPLPLGNVAPTLIHFPTLFEDKYVPKLRQIQIIRILFDAIISISSLIERVLWIIESHCQIHLSKVKLTPIYKGRSKDNDSPEWRLSLSFSGHVLVFGWIPIPFISVTLPTFIIPQPHALLQNLLTTEPLATAKLRRENIAENRIAIAALDSLDSWSVEVDAVATPPALGVDITLPGGVAVALEMMHGRDTVAGMRRQDESNFPPATNMDASISGSLSSWTTNLETSSKSRFVRSGRNLTTPAMASKLPAYDANTSVPWSFHLWVKGSISREKMSVHVTRCSAHHQDESSLISGSKFSTAGSFALWKPELTKLIQSKVPAERRSSYGHMVALASNDDSPSVCEMLLFPDENGSYAQKHRFLRMLDYDYAFDVYETQIDAITMSVGASHPMLKGGTMVTTIMEAIYALGSVTARDGAVVEPGEWKRKRNILRHLPAIDFTFGIQNAFIPSESLSYSEDGFSRVIPEMEGGRIMIRFIGGIGDSVAEGEGIGESNGAVLLPVASGIKMVADVGIDSLVLRNETIVKEFPELDIFDGDRLYSLLSGAFTASLSSHLRPQNVTTSPSTTGPNVKNPLEAYEVDFSNSNIAFKIKESTMTIGHRRVVMPTETSFEVKIVDSIVDMSMDGKTQCELSWDCQGLSPILQVTDVGRSPAAVTHEDKKQVALLIAPLRQGRLSFHISALGGILVQKAATSREDREGLYDWKFFNALVSPDEESPNRLMKVLHDKRTIEKMLQIIKVVNTDLHRILQYLMTQVWRAKEIFDQEGVSDPGHAIPGHKMARLFSLFLCGDVSAVDALLPIIRRVTRGEGLDVVKVKELLMQHVSQYDDWAPEIDRVVRWFAVMLGPLTVSQAYVEAEVPPLCELHHAERFADIPSAQAIYDQIQDKPNLPLDASFSNLLSAVAPYLSFRQVEYFLEDRKPTDWQPSDLRRLRYVYSIKQKVLDISESYGGLSFLPQSFLVSVFLGEATRASLRASRLQKKTPRHPLRRVPTLSTLRRRRMQAPGNASTLEGITERSEEDFVLTPAAKLVSQQNFAEDRSDIPQHLFVDLGGLQQPSFQVSDDDYELGDSLLGPQDVAILLQAGLTSPMKGSTVVQLNQRMLIDLVASQPRNFAVAVLAEIGTPGGQGAPRGLTSALMALLEMDQSSFTEVHRLDMHALLESWLPGIKVPRREDYMAGGRWARQSYYEAIYGVATNILEDAECYMALKSHLQRSRRNTESDPIPLPKEESSFDASVGMIADDKDTSERLPSKVEKLSEVARQKITAADTMGRPIMEAILAGSEEVSSLPQYEEAVAAYQQSFDACCAVLEVDKLAFQTSWFRDFYKRNYDALMIKSMYENVIDDVDKVRDWFVALCRGAVEANEGSVVDRASQAASSPNASPRRNTGEAPVQEVPLEEGGDPEIIGLLKDPTATREQTIVSAIIDAVVYSESDRERLKRDPLVRLLISNRKGDYNFAVVTAMGVITEGERGLELQAAFERLKISRGVQVVRADTGTARSLEYNAAKIEEAVESVVKLNKPFGLLGYSQGCANVLTAESLLLSGK